MKKLPGARLQVGQRKFSGIDFLQDRFLREVILVRDAGAALEHAPGFSAFDGEENHLPGNGVEPHFPFYLGFDVDAEVRDVGAMVFIEDAAVDDVVLRDEDEHIIEENQFACFVLGDRFDVLAETSFGQSPVRDGEVVIFAGGEFRSPPIAIEGRIAFEVERFLDGLAFARVEDELGHAARVADHLGLVGGHVVGNAVLGLAGGVALEEGGAAIFEAIEDRFVEFGGVGHRDLRDEGRAVAAVNASATLFFSMSLPCDATPNWFMSYPPSMVEESEFWPPVLE